MTLPSRMTQRRSVLQKNETRAGNPLRAFRAGILHFLDDPDRANPEDARVFHPDGVLVVRSGQVAAVGAARDVIPDLPKETPITHWPDGLLVPGFVDCHVHYPQTEMIASWGKALLEWLTAYTFPTEKEFANPKKARKAADFFLEELLRNGTTTALVIPTVHAVSVEAFFHAACRRNLRMICGKVLMDRNAPEGLTDTAETGFGQSRELIGRWHGKGRLEYAVTPRFAPTSTPEQLKMAGRLLREFKGVRLHTHLSENRDEVAWVKRLFPESRDYLHVYERFGLLGPGSLFAHGIYLSRSEFSRIGEAGAAIAFCPSSNLFLGSGLFDLEMAEAARIRVGLGTDVGAGTSLSLLRTMADAYKVTRLKNQRLSPLKAFYMATLGGARALGLEGVIGNFLPGKEADFVVLDDAATPLLARRSRRSRNLEDRLFALAMLGDDRAVKAVYVMGDAAGKNAAA